VAAILGAMNTPSPWFEGFETIDHTHDGVRLHARVGGRIDGPPLLLVHGFPQTHVLWHRVAQHLAPHYRLVLPDLRGYGDSDKPPGSADHAAHSKRAMAADLAALMGHLGHTQYAVAGHDRGGRVAHRLALDHPGAVRKLCVIDIAPTLDMYAATNMAFARAYYHWFHLIQPYPLPERMIEGCARDYLLAKLGGWGGVAHVDDMPAFVRDAVARLAPGGLLLASTINRTLRSYLPAIVGAEMVFRVLPRGTHHWAQFVRPEELEQAAVACGSAPGERRGMAYLPAIQRAW